MCVRDYCLPSGMKCCVVWQIIWECVLFPTYNQTGNFYQFSHNICNWIFFNTAKIGANNVQSIHTCSHQLLYFRHRFLQWSNYFIIIQWLIFLWRFICIHNNLQNKNTMSTVQQKTTICKNIKMSQLPFSSLPMPCTTMRITQNPLKTCKIWNK